MRRTDILKLQLTGSRGRFMTAKYKSQTGLMLKLNFKVKQILINNKDRIVAEVFIPANNVHQTMVFNLNSKGDLSYLAADRSKIQMSGSGLV